MADEFTKAALYGIKTFNKKVKEKIGIEKLIELLNEFINKTIIPYDRGAKCIGYENHLFLFETGTDVLEDTVISKRYGFIKWLVENDKIDFENMEGHGRLIGYLTDNMEKPTRDKVKEELVIMLLSISNSPIEDLILYLK